MASDIDMNPRKESHKKEEKKRDENTTTPVEFGSYHILDPPESSASGQIPIDRNPSKEHKKEEKKEKEDDKYYSFEYCTNIYITQQNTTNSVNFGSYPTPPPVSFAAGQIPINRTPSKEPEKKEEKKEAKKEDLKKYECHPKVLHIPSFCEEECIFRVHPGLRTTPADYEPMLISIGPYFHWKMQWNSPKMKNLKERYLQSFLKRAEGRGLTKVNIMNKLKDLETRAKSYYGDPITDMDGYEFGKMLFRDGCFVVEFVVRSKSTTTGCSDPHPPPIHVPDWMQVQIVRDMLLMENQLPFFVLNELYQLIMDTTQDRAPLLNLVEFTFSDVLSKLRYFSLILNEVNDQEVKHLLQLVHILCRPHQSEVTQVRTPHPAASMESSYIRSANELVEAGVDFKKVEAGMISLFDIRFNRGTLEIPSFRLGDSSVSLFKNLIAYEQHSIDVYPKYFSDYVVFMDDLIKTDKDVSILRLNGIILNGLGNDNEVAHLFNTLAKGVVYSSRDFCYATVCYDLIQHCKKPRNVLMSKLRRDYFYSPWAGISTVAAILLLFLSATQTITSILGLHK